MSETSTNPEYKVKKISVDFSTDLILSTGPAVCQGAKPGSVVVQIKKTYSSPQNNIWL